jgi:hypothetical protein
MVKFLSIISVALLLFLGCAAFALSYNALQDIALSSGIEHNLSFLWPLVLDAFVICAGVAALRAGLQGERSILPRVLVFLFSALSVFFNITDAGSNNLARLVFSLPPITLLLALEILLEQIAQAVNRNSEADTLASVQDDLQAAQAELADVQASVASLELREKELHQVVNERKVTVPTLQQAMLDYWRDAPMASNAEVARAVGCKDYAVSRALGKLQEQGVVKKNGRGVEVLA